MHKRHLTKSELQSKRSELSKKISRDISKGDSNSRPFETKMKNSCDDTNRNYPFARSVSMNQPYSTSLEAQWFGFEEHGKNVGLKYCPFPKINFPGAIFSKCIYVTSFSSTSYCSNSELVSKIN